MMIGILPIALWVAVLVFALGFFIRAAVYFALQKRQNAEIIAILKEIRDNLNRS